jgi:hypothetical protein
VIHWLVEPVRLVTSFYGERCIYDPEPRTSTRSKDILSTSCVLISILSFLIHPRASIMSQRLGTSSVVHDDEHTINCQDLTYSFSEGSESALTGATLQLPRGARCLLVGANGGADPALPYRLQS